MQITDEILLTAANAQRAQWGLQPISAEALLSGTSPLDINRLRAALEAALPLIRAQVVETDAARDVLAERQRQISVEHWTTHHDDLHGRMEMSRAARCYILKAIHTENDDARYNPHLASDEQYRPPYPRFEPPQGWPWESTAWKPKGTRADLVRAGALILAEIERLDRALSPREAGE